jgi:TRAP-type mannitol/chloroaromatic compound transport system permease small subunit
VPKIVRLYVRSVDALNRVVGRIVMYMIFAMIGALLLSSSARTFFSTSFIWSVEMSQFMLAAYFILGGAYSLQLDSHVRMDLLYSRWSVRGRAFADSITAMFLVFYVFFLFLGGISSSEYAVAYNQRNFSAWSPPIAPIKIIVTIGIGLMLLQTVSVFFKDLARTLGRPIQ